LHEREAVADFGYITINKNINAMSLDAHCDRCRGAINRKFEEHAKLGSRRPQGRPMGALLAWLRLECTGDPDVHRALYDPINLPHVLRLEAREWGHNLGTLRSCFAAERQPFAHEVGLEPLELP